MGRVLIGRQLHHVEARLAPGFVFLVPLRDDRVSAPFIQNTLEPGNRHLTST